MTFYLRMEAVNLGNFVYDTQDLATVRGGGLALLYSTKWVPKGLGLDSVSLGASGGLFQLKATTWEEAEDIRREVEKHLQTYHHRFVKPRGDEGHLDLGLATFVVDVVQEKARAEENREEGEGEDVSFPLVRESLLAANRWRQMTSLDLAVPRAASKNTRKPVCAIDRVRPSAKDRRGGDGEPISESVYQRREFGRVQKQQFYEGETDEEFEGGFSQSFQELALDPSRGNLDGKMGVLYLDGNHIGKLVREMGKGPTRLFLVDEELRGRRQSILRKILVHARDEDAGFREASPSGTPGAIRFETLLWGGDDILWVMPAWRALEVVSRFFGSGVWEPPLDGFGAHDELTHAGGLVLCHDKAPIYRIRQLADRLADQAKEKSRKQNLVAYEVLESFDHVGDNVEEYRTARTPPGLHPSDLLLEPEKLGDALTVSARLLPELPHGKVIDAAAELREEGPGALQDPGGAAMWLRKTLPGATVTELDRLLDSLGGEPIGWLHLAELWDFLAAGRA